MNLIEQTKKATDRLDEALKAYREGRFTDATLFFKQLKDDLEEIGK